ncbi:hypothetical protein GGR54DRAFT_633597 [Hypoxylon sp. NC1633]|nr:hypothetical protein GGR54DRAFT_633597 [Hypoxylon sp. NC1633]
MPPPASQSYFDQVPGFVPNNSASFDDEFFRFASSQGIVSGSQQYRRERTRAIRDELKYHYTSQPYDESEALQSIPELSKEFLDRQEKLKVYQNMCREIGVKPRGTIVGCRQELNDVLVNIIDYIDARRVGKKVEIWNWSKFDEFCEYTLQNDKRIDKEEAKADGGFLSALLQRLTGTRAGRKRSRAASEVADPGVMKRKRVYEADSHVPKRSRLSVH